MSEDTRIFTFTFFDLDSAQEFYNKMNEQQIDGVSLESEKVKIIEWLYSLGDLIHQIEELDRLRNISVQKP